MRDWRSTWRRCLALLFYAALLLPLQAQQIPNSPTLSELTSQAALIFTGTVLAVEHVPPATENGIGTVRVTFHVDEGLRGVRTGERFTITEWDGLWSSGECYRVGESLVLLLHAPSGELGLTSPVGGAHGRIALPQNEAAKISHPVAPTSGATRVGHPPSARRQELLRALRRAVVE
jgi:hypothetical protein